MLLAVALTAVAFTTAPATAAAGPALTLADTAPVAVHGTGFHRRERIRVRVVTARTDVTRRVRAGRRGRFTARFSSATATDRCSALLVTAVGATGDRARLVRGPRPACPPA